MQKKIVVCNLCRKEISVKQGTGGLKSHLKFKHRQQYAELEEMVMMENNEQENQDQEEEGDMGKNPSFPNAGATAAVAAASAALVSRRGRRRFTFTTVSNRIRTSATIRSTTSSSDEQRKHEKHLMDMWSYTRREIDALRQQLKKKKKKNNNNDDDDDDGDEESNKDIEQDIRMLRKRKAEYAAMLGLSE
ncbi:hypothetical protein ACHAXH_003655 [Discostella pseudostelligera]